jgi:hypothetical protein
MSKEFEKLEALLYSSKPSESDPQVDRGEAAKLAARWGGWFSRLARSALSFLRCDGPTEAPLGAGNDVGTIDTATQPMRPLKRCPVFL